MDTRQSPLRLSPFEVLRVLDRFGADTFYLAKSPAGLGLPETVVLEVAGAGKGKNPAPEAFTRLERLKDEGRWGPLLTHPAIVPSYGIREFPSEGLCALVREYVDGVTLDRLLDYYCEHGLRLPFAVLVGLMAPVLKALEHVSTRVRLPEAMDEPPLHRDLRPERIVLSYDGKVRLLGFEAAPPSTMARDVALFGLRHTLRCYMAPEQVFEPDQLGPWSNVFSAGLILFELASLQPIFPPTRVAQELTDSLRDFRYIDYEQLIDRTRYPGLRELLAHVLQRDIHARCPTPGKMAASLDALLRPEERGLDLQQFARQLEDELTEAEEAATLIGVSLEEELALPASTPHVVRAPASPPSGTRAMDTRSTVSLARPGAPSAASPPESANSSTSSNRSLAPLKSGSPATAPTSAAPVRPPHGAAAVPPWETETRPPPSAGPMAPSPSPAPPPRAEKRAPVPGQRPGSLPGATSGMPAPPRGTSVPLSANPFDPTPSPKAVTPTSLPRAVPPSIPPTVAKLEGERPKWLLPAGAGLGVLLAVVVLLMRGGC